MSFLRTHKRIRLIFSLYVKFIQPILLCAAFFSLRLVFVDKGLQTQPFSYVAILIVIQVIAGGIVSGLFTTIITTLFVMFIYMQTPLSIIDLSRVIIAISTGFFVTLIIGIFERNRRKLKQLTQDLTFTSKRLRRVMDSNHSMILITDKDGVIKEVNKTFEAKMGVSNSELSNASIYIIEPWLLDTDLQNKFKETIAKLTENRPAKFDSALVVNNKVIYSEIVLTLIKEDTFAEVVIAIRDRTEKKLYEDELVKSKVILNKLIDSNIVGMNVANLRGELVEANAQFLKILGYTPEEFENQGISWNKVTVEEYMDISRQKIQELLTTGSMSVFEKEYYHRDGHKVSVLITGVAINKEQALCLVVDLTPQRTLQQKKDEFISIASHELKTPMTVIKGYLQLLAKKIDVNNPESKQFLDTIDFQLDKLNTLVNELHDISKIQANKLKIRLEKIDIVMLVNRSILEINPFAENHNISFINNQKEVFILGDLIRLEQVLVNLLTNAIKYSPEGGEIKVTLSKGDTNVYISVQDYGLGISPNDLPNIFSKFFQVESSSEIREGLGLGLYISSEIIKQHNGKISVNSTLNKGSTFTVELPISKN